MLILTREIGEAVIIGRDVTIRVLEVRGAYVRLGIEAPRSVTVHRREIYEQIQRDGHSTEKDLAPLSAD